MNTDLISSNYKAGITHYDISDSFSSKSTSASFKHNSLFLTMTLTFESLTIWQHYPHPDNKWKSNIKILWKSYFFSEYWF